MSMGSSEVRSMLKSVELDGAVVVQKKKILWLLGWKNDKANAWKELLDHWEEMGNARKDLFGLEVNDKLVLTTPVLNAASGYMQVTEWAQEPARKS